MHEKPELERLYKAIFRRKSVRKYKAEALPKEAQEGILKKTAALRALRPKTPVAFRVLSEKQVKGMVPAKAPHYLAVYAESEPMAQMNAGFMLQQMDLWFSSQGLGSCWLGMPNPAPEAATCDGLPFVIMLAFGVPAEKAQRENAEEFRRKSIEEITDISGIPALAEALRLAPSGVNRQPWFLTGSNFAPRLCSKKNNILQKALFGDLPHIDMGIALCHLWLAAEQENKFLSFEGDPSPQNVPGKYEYIMTIRLKA